MAENQNSTTSMNTQNDICPALVKKIGKTTYFVMVHFSETSRETMSDKIKRLIWQEVEA